MNTGIAGTPYHKVLKDANKLSQIGNLTGIPTCPVKRWFRELPVQDNSPYRQQVAVEEVLPERPPLLLIFIETLNGKLATLASKILKHNKQQSIESSVDGVFVLNKGVILHADPRLDLGWSPQRIPGHPLAYMAGENWEVLLLMMLVIWNHLWTGIHPTTDLGRYYMDLDYFLEEHRPRIKVISDRDYESQISGRSPVSGFQLTMPVQLVPDPDAGNAI